MDCVGAYDGCGVFWFTFGVLFLGSARVVVVMEIWRGFGICISVSDGFGSGEYIGFRGMAVLVRVKGMCHTPFAQVLGLCLLGGSVVILCIPRLDVSLWDVAVGA